MGREQPLLRAGRSPVMHHIQIAFAPAGGFSSTPMTRLALLNRRCNDFARRCAQYLPRGVGQYMPAWSAGRNMFSGEEEGGGFQHAG